MHKKEGVMLVLLLGVFLLNFGSAVLVNVTMFNDTFESGNLNLWDGNGPTDWDLSTTRAVSSTTSVEASSDDNDLLSDDLNMSGSIAIYISFSYWDTGIDDADDVILYYWDGTVYDSILELGVQTEGQWNNFSVKITDTQYFDPDFHIYIEGTSIDNGEFLWVDDVLILKEVSNEIPVISNITLSTNRIKGGSSLTIYANSTSNGVNDSDGGSLNLYCSNVTNTPSSTNNTCSSTDTTYPYDFTCSYNVQIVDVNETVYCRVYDGISYSQNVSNATYSIDSTSPALSIMSVAGDSVSAYFDTNGTDGVTSVNISGESEMSCRWSDSDTAYGLMSFSCANDSIYSICNLTGFSEGSHTRYISCVDSVGNDNNATNNLNVDFTLDYTVPTTSDNSNTNIHLSSYNVTISELDNVDADPTTYYCVDTVGTCAPNVLIDNGGVVSFSLRGRNYLRYYSVDDAGNNQSVQNKTININRLPVLISASDNATTIKGGDIVNVSTVSSDTDSDLGQNFTLFVCDTSSATSSGCNSVERCNSSGSANLSCTFASELDSTTHSWYAFIFDDLEEAAVNNSFSGSYTTDSIVPELTIISPENITYSSNSISVQVLSSENLNWSAYNINETGNVTITRIAGVFWSSTISGLADGFYNLTFYANDSVGNYNMTEPIYFTVNTSVPDTVSPTITIIIPVNNTYYTSASTLLNITSNENLTWAGYSVNGSSIANLSNTSLTSWNTTYSFVEGINTIIFYANDSSNNRGNASVTIYTDLNAPNVTSFDCDSSVNNSQNLTCNSTFYDSVGLDYVILSYNFSGDFVNSSQIDLSGTSDELNDTFMEGNYSIPGNYTIQIYLFDLSGQMNGSSSSIVHIFDDSSPVINNYTYSPIGSGALDPGIIMSVNTSIAEDYAINSVYLMFKNETDSDWSFSLMTNTSLTDYNVSFVLPSGNVTIKINATDVYGNVNISDNTTFEVELDISQNITTNITSVFSISSAGPDQRSETNILGYIILNTTSDSNLTYNVTVFAASDVVGRFNLNNTFNQTENYTASNGTVLYIPLYVNSTGLDRLYPFNITVSSEAGTELFERNLNVQPSGPYLSVSIDTYSSRVTQGETGVTFSATVTNLGTADAQGVYLNWSLPTGFVLAGGSLNRSLATLPVGVSGTNTITIDAFSNLTSNLTITALASSTNADFANASKLITVTNPVTISQIIEILGSSGGSSGGVGSGGDTEIVYYKTIEVVRGNKTSFTIDFGNTEVNKTLTNVVINVTGFPEKYIEIYPNLFSAIPYKENRSFMVSLTAPSYKSYEEHILKAVIKGTLTEGNNQESYTEIQNIRLIIQEISYEEAIMQLRLANESIDEMIENGYNVEEVEQLFNLAENKLNIDLHNKDSYDISTSVIQIKKTAFEARRLIDLIRYVLSNPKEINLLTGNVVNKDATQNVFFYSMEISDVLDMADAAFERGDYTIALERAQKAELLLRLEQKGNVLVFLYLYWPQLLIVFVVLFLITKIVYSQYSKRRISIRIKDLNHEEENINKLLIVNQKNYYFGRISSSDYHNRANQYHNRLAVLRKARINLRNKRIKMLAPEAFAKELENEKRDVELEIKRLQNLFYKDHKISDNEYKPHFEILSNRLAEIEDERAVVDVEIEGKYMEDLK